ncbi:zinc transporter [Aliiroseovarius sediminilitoris]|uniref:Zinc transporter n=1 Tax=Aliiroseovarius sediminilitoris TaxID=1173584 RepID=A0A1I0PW81_9RHOB|nr:zinc transporter ZntB [Aliiroseovarius sediminilitoris]SEW18731.1 zinc transporter [Aliiroseovarius sediminilitoris]
MSEYEIQTTDAPEEDGLVFAVTLRGDGSGTFADWQTVESWTPEDDVIWIHLDRASDRAQAWLRDQSGLSPATAEALLAEETRPRVFRGKTGLTTVIRGMNLNAGQRSEDMIALRIWSDGTRVITLRDQRLQSVRDVLAALVDHGTGPATIAETYLRLIARVNERIGPTIDAIEDQIDDIESNLETYDTSATRKSVADLRQRTVILRRYLAPQRTAMGELLSDPPVWAGDTWRTSFRETTDRVIGYVEELDQVKERALVIKDDIANEFAEKTNRTLYVLAVISAVFLPLSFLTGLLGINVGGMPGVANDNAFWIFSGAIAVLLVVEIAMFRYLKWL